MEKLPGFQYLLSLSCHQEQECIYFTVAFPEVGIITLKILCYELGFLWLIVMLDSFSINALTHKFKIFGITATEYQGHCQWDNILGCLML